jgi:hypothetical protein
MAKKIVAKIKEKTKQEKIIEKEMKQMRFLEKLGFVQTVFDFYTSPVT